MSMVSIHSGATFSLTSGGMPTDRLSEKTNWASFISIPLRIVMLQTDIIIRKVTTGITVMVTSSLQLSEAATGLPKTINRVH